MKRHDLEAYPRERQSAQSQPLLAPPVACMKMWRVVLVVVHPNRDTKKAADNWHSTSKHPCHLSDATSLDSGRMDGESQRHFGGTALPLRSFRPASLPRTEVAKQQHFTQALVFRATTCPRNELCDVAEKSRGEIGRKCNVCVCFSLIRGAWFPCGRDKTVRLRWPIVGNDLQEFYDEND